ncbi:hypothetical protein [Streptomyces abyssalis]|uniref:hypothetical protein n=1 Tax=Streptomyces abyssalis TaxID=933944 RepID=UPI001C0DBABA|nr:hypothetical protein [Streptomyces abyssalis]
MSDSQPGHDSDRARSAESAADPQVAPAVSLVKAGRPAGGPAPAAGEAEFAFEGYLARAVRMPVRIVTLLLVLPVRMAWDALTVCGRALRRTLWVPFARVTGRAAGRLWHRVLAPVLFALFVWPWVALWRYVLVPAGRGLGWLGKTTGAGVAWVARSLWTGAAWLGRSLVLVPLGLLYRYVLTPVGHGLAAAARALGAGLAWLGGNLVVVPLGLLYRYVLTPVGHGVLAVMLALGAGLGWLWRWVVMAPCGLLYRYVLTPVGRGLVAVVLGTGAGLGWLWRNLVVAPCRFVHRRLLKPTGRGVAVVAREVADAFVHAWRVAGRVSRAVFRFLGRVLRFLFADPAVWMWRNVVRPVGRGLRDGVWRPAAHAVREAGRSVRAALAAARASVRETRAELRRALFGGPPAGSPAPEPAAEPPVPDRRALSGGGRVPWVAGSPHNSTTTPGTFGSKRDDADFRTL